MSTDQPIPQTVPSRSDSDSEEDDPRVLFEQEILWRDRQKWLEEKGYMLSPRFRPGWVPSWGPDDDYFDFEDGLWITVCKPHPLPTRTSITR